MKVMNNQCFFKVDMLGRIYIKDMIIFYDEPLLFSCINDFGQYFIANCIDMDEIKKEWLFLPITEARLIRGLKGNISGYDLFRNSEGDFLWKVIQYNANELAMAKPIDSNRVSDDDLPEKDVYFNIIDDEFLKEYDNKTLEESAKERREILDISLEPHDSHEHEIDASVLGKVLDYTQNIINVIAHKKGVNAKVPKQTKDDNKLMATGFYAASFGIRLKSNNLANLLNESEIQKNISQFMDILDAKSDTKILTRIFSELNPTVSIQYKNLLKLLYREGISIKTSCAFPNKTYRQIYFGKKDIERSIKNLEEDVKEIVREVCLNGSVTAIDTDARTFGFKTLDDEKIKGVIGDNVNVQEYILPKYAEVKIKMTSKLNDLTGKEDIKYKLLELKYI